MCLLSEASELTIRGIEKCIIVLRAYGKGSTRGARKGYHQRILLWAVYCRAEGFGPGGLRQGGNVCCGKTQGEEAFLRACWHGSWSQCCVNPVADFTMEQRPKELDLKGLLAVTGAYVVPRLSKWIHQFFLETRALENKKELGD